MRGPGFDHSYLVNVPVWKEMPARRQIISDNQRGTGKSPATRGPEDMTVDGMTACIQNMVKNGHSHLLIIA